MSFEDTELLKEFAVESQEHLADIENQLLTIESQGDDMDVALVNTVFRAIHSIKGAAGFMGLDTLGGLAHRAEEVLNRLRSHELRPTSIVIETLLKATDRLKELIDEIETSNDADVGVHLTALEQILSGEIGAEVPAIRVVASMSVVESNTINRNIAEAIREFLIESFDLLESIERDLLGLEKHPNAIDVLNGVFRSVHTIKGSAGFLGYNILERLTHAAENKLGLVRDGSVQFETRINDAMLQTIDASRRILHSIEKSGSEGDEDVEPIIRLLNEMYEPTEKTKQKPRPSSPKIPEAESSAPVCPPEPVSSTNEAKRAQAAPKAIVEDAKASSPGSGATSETSAADSTIRVDVALLDKLMTRVGELVLARNQILQFNNIFNDSALQSATQRLNLITTELQEGVMKTRMQPIGNVWSKFPRLVRDLATICEKEVRIEMEGKDTELDKTIIEAIKDPLTHLVRNTVDHGIEKPEVRASIGKPVEGCLTLKAYHEGGQVNIEIVDDGAGLNLERIKNKAIEKGLISADQAAKLLDREASQLIFLPGFSTAEKVSNVSGRGVGMDVVKTNIEKIGGTVDIQSVFGQGTTIKIKIPLTLAIIPALIVSSGDNRYAIPQVNLLELVRLEAYETRDSIEWIHGAPVYRLRGRLLPLVSLRRELGLKEEDLVNRTESLNIVVLRADDRHFGLIVDKINDSEEIVVKPLGKQFKNVAVYSGATIMGDGRVALILDVMGLAHSAHVVSSTQGRGVSDVLDRSSTNRSHLQTLLVLGVGQDRRVALPLNQVTRLEKISASTIETANDKEVVQYRGEILPLIRLTQSFMSTSSSQDSDMMNVVVYSQDGRSIGIVVDQVIDIVETDLTGAKSASGNGIIKSVVIQGHVTDLLDLPAVIRTMDSNFFAESMVN